MTKIILDVDATRKDLRDNAVQAISDLDLIISQADTATTAQLRMAIKWLARYEKIVIKQLVRMVE